MYCNIFDLFGAPLMVSFRVTANHPNTQHRIKPEVRFSTLFPVTAETWRRFLLTGALKWQYKRALFSRSPHSVHAWTWMRVRQRYQRGIVTLTNHSAENNTTRNMFAFSITPSNSDWQSFLICIDIYAFAKITRDWLKKTRSMIETEVHHQHKQVN